MTAAVVQPAPTPTGQRGDLDHPERPTLAEPALCLVTLTATASFTRLFDTSGFLVRLLVIGVIAHLLAAVTRRVEWPGSLRFVLFLGGLGVMITAAYLPGTGIAGFLPTADTITTARSLVNASWAQFSTVKAPAPVLPGFLLVAAAAVWVTAWMSDWIAFRAWAAVEALMPSAAIFVFAAVLGTAQGRTTSAGMFAIAALAFVALHRASRDGAASSWIANRRVEGSRALVLACVPVVLLAGAIGAVAGPSLPGADQPALTGWRHQGDDAGDESLASPLVDLRKRLISQSDTELFTVNADHRSYWRLMSLEEFDGREWKSSGSFSAASGDVPHDNRPKVATTTNHQAFKISATGAVWVPAAFEVTDVTKSSSELRWDPGAAALIAGQKRTSADGLTYSLVSQAPDPTAAQTSSATDDIPSSVRDTYLGLPGNLSPAVAAKAKEVTRDAKGPAAKAKALEAWFRAPGNFTYSLDPSSGQSSDALYEFLFQSKEGYCQQFAAAFAAMARTLGIPSRVAVGYTWGDQDAAGTYHVKGRNAHAWPEVWLEGVGWLPFEPTPGRGLPDAAAWSGTTAAQDDGTGAAGTTTAPSTTGTGTGTATTTAPASPTTAAPGASSSSSDDTLGALPASGSGGPTPWWRRVLPLALSAAVLALAWALVVPALLAARRRRRRAQAGTPAARILLAWTEATEALAAVGLAPLPSESHAEHAARVARAWPGKVDQDLATLAATTADTRWSGAEPSPAQADDAWARRGEVVAAVDARLGRFGRARRNLDPSPLLQGRRSGRRFRKPKPA